MTLKETHKYLAMGQNGGLLALQILGGALMLGGFPLQEKAIQPLDCDCLIL